MLLPDHASVSAIFSISTLLWTYSITDTTENTSTKQHICCLTNTGYTATSSVTFKLPYCGSFTPTPHIIIITSDFLLLPHNSLPDLLLLYLKIHFSSYISHAKSITTDKQSQHSLQNQNIDLYMSFYLVHFKPHNTLQTKSAFKPRITTSFNSSQHCIQHCQYST